MVQWLLLHSNNWCLWAHVECLLQNLKGQGIFRVPVLNYLHQSVTIETEILRLPTIIWEEKCLFLAETWPLRRRVYKEFLTTYYVVWNLGQNMEQLYGVRGSAILKKEKPTLIIIELDPTNQLWPGYNLATLEVTYLHVLWPDSLWSVVE